jgi:Xaa-Pro aminopeptidase
VCSVTRFVHFGHLPDDLRRKAEAVAKVDAAFIAATHPGQTLGDIFQSATEAYAAAGYPDEWKLHHQGGPAGYEPREYLATPSSTDLVSIGQVFAWNPSITGTKSEDSILITKQGHEVLTAMKDWPMVQVRIKDETFQRPAILERT